MEMEQLRDLVPLVSGLKPALGEQLDSLIADHRKLKEDNAVLESKEKAWAEEKKAMEEEKLRLEGTTRKMKKGEKAPEKETTVELRKELKGKIAEMKKKEAEHQRQQKKAEQQRKQKEAEQQRQQQATENRVKLLEAKVTQMEEDAEKWEVEKLKLQQEVDNSGKVPVMTGQSEQQQRQQKTATGKRVKLLEAKVTQWETEGAKWEAEKKKLQQKVASLKVSLRADTEQEKKWEYVVDANEVLKNALESSEEKVREAQEKNSKLEKLLEAQRGREAAKWEAEKNKLEREIELIKTSLMTEQSQKQEAVVKMTEVKNALESAQEKVREAQERNSVLENKLKAEQLKVEFLKLRLPEVSGIATLNGDEGFKEFVKGFHVSQEEGRAGCKRMICEGEGDDIGGRKKLVTAVGINHETAPSIIPVPIGTRPTLIRGARTEIEIDTLPPGSAQPPTVIKVSRAQNGGGVTISWEPPRPKTSGDIREYSVYMSVERPCYDMPPPPIKPVSTSDNLHFLKVYRGPSNQCHVPAAKLRQALLDKTTDGRPATVFMVTAKNDNGYGPGTEVRWPVGSSPQCNKNHVQAVRKTSRIHSAGAIFVSVEEAGED